eukprot:snap_masked-scaffold_34-processed-gene-0.47-mRNA-1 protein AED:1.00 eAED:1.00 QI:0/-1/0/0/-1/1/1/0/60
MKAVVISKIQYGNEFWDLENKNISKALNKLPRSIKGVPSNLIQRDKSNTQRKLTSSKLET